MSVIFKVLGSLILLLAIGWTLLMFSVPTPVADAPGAALGRVLAFIPGASVALTGLLLIALGVVLDNLKRITRASERTAWLLDEQFNPRDQRNR